MIRAPIQLAVVAALLSSAPDDGTAATLQASASGGVAMGGINAPPEMFDYFSFYPDPV